MKQRLSQVEGTLLCWCGSNYPFTATVDAAREGALAPVSCVGCGAMFSVRVERKPRVAENAEVREAAKKALEAAALREEQKASEANE